MALHTRRQLLRSGAVAGTAILAGCVFGFGGETECETGRTVHQADATLPPDAAWPTYRHDDGNTGYAPEASGPGGGDVGVAWRYSACTEAESGVAVRDGHTAAGGLVVDARTGEAAGGEWHGHMRTPTFEGGTLYVSTHDLEARDAGGGTVEWTFQTDVDAGALPAPTVAGGTVYVPGSIDDPQVYAVRADDGTERWRYRTPGDVGAPVAVHDGTVFVVDDAGTLTALAAADGDLRWTRSLGVDSPGVVPVAVDGRLYLGSSEGVQARRADDGAVVWTRNDLGGSLAVGDDTVFVAGREAVTALDAAEGTERWRNDALEVDPGAPAVGREAVYLGDAGRSDDSPVVALDRATGEERWRVATRSVFFGDYTRAGVVGVAVAGAVVYAATAPGDLYAFASQG
ncbi:MAG: PQQ-binding-like beta-propeller repeat protein [Haloferacaceae archaeon]